LQFGQPIFPKLPILTTRRRTARCVDTIGWGGIFSAKYGTMGVVPARNMEYSGQK